MVVPCVSPPFQIQSGVMGLRGDMATPATNQVVQAWGTMGTGIVSDRRPAKRAVVGASGRPHRGSDGWWRGRRSPACLPHQWVAGMGTSARAHGGCAVIDGVITTGRPHGSPSDRWNDRRWVRQATTTDRWKMVVANQPAHAVSRPGTRGVRVASKPRTISRTGRPPNRRANLCSAAPRQTTRTRTRGSAARQAEWSAARAEHRRGDTDSR